MTSFLKSPRAGRPSYRPALEPLEDRCVPAQFFVAVGGNDGNGGALNSPFATIQHALDVARNPGDVVTVRGGTYHEKVTFRASGVALEAFGGEKPIIRGDGLFGQDIILIKNLNNIRVSGLEIAGNFSTDEASGVRVIGRGSNIQILNNEIHDIHGVSAMGITVYGKNARKAISGVVIDGNKVYNCDASPSEAVTLNGNVSGFRISNNTVHDINNIGIDMVGGEKDFPEEKVARNGVVANNLVYRCHSPADHSAAGIYVDGGRGILITGNISHHNDLGIEVGAENAGAIARRVTVRDNLIAENDRGGLVFGGFEKSRGRVNNCIFTGNIVYHNDTSNGRFGQLVINYGDGNRVTNNVFVASDDGVMIDGVRGNRRVRLDHNLWFSSTGAGAVSFTWNGRTATGFDAYRAFSHQDGSSIFADPMFLKPADGDFRLKSGSPVGDIGAGGAARVIPPA